MLHAPTDDVFELGAEILRISICNFRGWGHLGCSSFVRRFQYGIHAGSKLQSIACYNLQSTQNVNIMKRWRAGRSIIAAALQVTCCCFSESRSAIPFCAAPSIIRLTLHGIMTENQRNSPNVSPARVQHVADDSGKVRDGKGR